MLLRFGSEGGSRRRKPVLLRNILRRTCGDDEKLSDILHKLDEPSLSKLVRDHEGGKLEAVCCDSFGQRFRKKAPGGRAIHSYLTISRTKRA